MRDTVWAAYIHTGEGLLTERPFKASTGYDYGWWNERLGVQITKLGLDQTGNDITFASRDYNEVKLFIQGAKSFRLMVNNRVKKFLNNDDLAIHMK